MTERFDPYYTWLGIPPEEQPPNCYRLLGIRLFETNPLVIENAANRQMSHLRTFQVGPRSALSQQLLNEVAAAKIRLLNPAKKEEYDRRLREEVEAPVFEETLPNVSAAPVYASRPRGRQAVLAAVLATVAALVLLTAVLFVLRQSFQSSDSPPAPAETAHAALEEPPVQKEPETVPEEASPRQAEVPSPVEPEPIPSPVESPPTAEPESPAVVEIPPPQEKPALSDLFEAARWLHADRSDEGVLTRLDFDAATMAVNPACAVLAVGGDVSRPGPVRFFAAGKESAEGGKRPLCELADRLGALVRTERATCVEFSPTGQLLAIGEADGSVHVWSVPAGREVASLGEGGAAVRAVAFNQNERLLASIDAEGNTIRLWSLADQEAVRSVDLPGTTSRSFLFFPRGDIMVVGLHSGEVVVFDAYDDAKRTMLPAGRGSVRAVAAARGNLILAGNEDGTVTVFQPQPRFVLGPFEPDQKPVDGLAVHDQSALVAIWGGDSSIRLWQCAEGRAWARLDGHEGPVLAAAFSRDGNTLFSLSADRTIRAWNTPPVPDNGLAERIRPSDPGTPASQSLASIPDEAAQKAARERLLGKYDLGAKRPLPEKQELAETLLAAARAASESPEEYYVLLTAAIAEACDSGNVESMSEAISRLCGGFECEKERLTTEAFVECASKVFQREQAAILVSLVEERALGLLLDEARHEDAKRLSDAMYAMCQKDVAKEFLPRARVLRDKIAAVVDRKELALPKKNSLTEWRDERFRAGLIKKYGGTVESERAVQQALRWLASVQFPDGGWSFDHGLHPDRKGNASDAGNRRDARNGATATALLPFLAAGNTHRTGEYKGVVARGLEFLSGRISPQKVRNRPAGGSLWNNGEVTTAHPMGGLVFAEALAMSGDKRLKPIIQQLAAFSLAAEDPGVGGWNGYQVQREGETHVTLAQIQFLFTSGLLGKETHQRTSRFLDSVQYDGGTRYYARRNNHSENMRDDAAGLYLRVLLGCEPDNPALVKGIARLREERWRMYDAETSLSISQLLFQLGGKDWADWNAAYSAKVIREQETEGLEKGSWHYPSSSTSHAGGRLYSTATVTLILQTYYRYPRLLEETQ